MSIKGKRERGRYDCSVGLFLGCGIKLFLDNHVLIWLDEGQWRLGKNSLPAINESLASDQSKVVNISFCEVAVLVEK